MNWCMVREVRSLNPFTRSVLSPYFCTFGGRQLSAWHNALFVMKLVRKSLNSKWISLDIICRWVVIAQRQVKVQVLFPYHSHDVKLCPCHPRSPQQVQLETTGRLHSEPERLSNGIIPMYVIGVICVLCVLIIFLWSLSSRSCIYAWSVTDLLIVYSANYHTNIQALVTSCFTSFIWTVTEATQRHPRLA